jgi:multidrug resistance efflux pump
MSGRLMTRAEVEAVAYRLASEKLYAALIYALAEVEVLRAQVQEADAAVARVRTTCEQQVMDRSPHSSDRQFNTLDRIDGWNDALEMVERALDGEQ